MNPNSDKAFDRLAPLSSEFLEKSLASGRLPAQGLWDATDMPRLLSQVERLKAKIEWRLAPDDRPLGPGRRRRRWWLEAKTQVECRCERCLEPVEISLAARRGFEFFPSAEIADEQTEKISAEDELHDPDLAEVDYLSPEDGLTLTSLIEEEILLTLPMSPRHDACRPSAFTQAVEGDAPESERVQPFASLRDLLKKPKSN
jgi:uncharacterized protein